MKPISKDAPLKEAIIVDAQASAADLDTSNGYVQVGNGTPVAINGSTYKFEGDGIPANLIMGYKYEAYAAGTPKVSEEDLSGISLAADHQYVAYANVNGTLHSWGVIFTSAPAAASDVVTALVNKINTSPSVGITAAAGTTANDLEMTGTLAAGDFEQTSSEGGTVSVGTAYVAPIGSEDEVKAAIGQNVFGTSAFDCDRYTIVWMDFVNHNSISGQGAMRIVKSVLYVKDNTDGADLATALTELFDGTTTPYIGDVKKAL